MSCPCGGVSYEACCGPRHDGRAPAETAEALMRSRYAAFVRADVAYLAATQTKQAEDWADTGAWARSVGWAGLTIVDRADDEVEFIARYVDGAGLTSLRERSTFILRDGRWLYDRGSPEVTCEKVERNAPCPCGSGRKYKQCHA